MTPSEFFERLWEQYVEITPTALEIRKLLRDHNEPIVEDHVAFRTFNLAPIGLDALAAPFLAWGYECTGTYHFARKKLRACSYSHPSGDYPRVFISELLTEMFSQSLQADVSKLVAAVNPGADVRALMTQGRVWPATSLETWERLTAESEYAGWLSAFGFRANHFTVSVNALKTLVDVESLNVHLEAHGFALNTSGGKVKGSAEVYLEQSSTLADVVEWTFEGGVTHPIPSCYTEFAYRHRMADGSLFDGFVAESADRIFESTDLR